MIINITGPSQSGKTRLEFELLEHMLDWLVSEMRIASSVMIKTLGKATPTSATAREQTYDALQNHEIDMKGIDNHRLGTIDRTTLELLKSKTSFTGDRMQRLTKVVHLVPDSYSRLLFSPFLLSHFAISSLTSFLVHSIHFFWFPSFRLFIRAKLTRQSVKSTLGCAGFDIILISKSTTLRAWIRFSPFLFRPPDQVIARADT